MREALTTPRSVLHYGYTERGVHEMNTTAHEDRVDSIIGSLEGFALDEYGNNLHALLDDGHTARGLIEDACYWHGWPCTQQLIADTLAAARTLADTADEPITWYAN